MIGTLRRAHRNEKGFTLVELLIVVTILGILAAVVTTSLIGLTANAKTNACLEEKRTVQTAMDAMMAKNSIATVTAQGAATNSWADKPVGAGTEFLAPNYLRQTNTKGAYTYSAAGLVTAVAGAPGSC